MNRRQKAILRRNLFLGFIALVLVALICIIVFVVSAINQKTTEKPQNKDTSSIQSENSSDTSSKEEPEEPKTVQLGEYTLDATYNKLLLVNGENPLPDDYDYDGNLTEIPKEYIKGSLTKIDKDVWVYLKAMLDNARKEGIDIGVWSPYRSYETQKMLFEKQVNKQIQNGVPKEQAEDKAATIVARPGTSEHHTGLALDINCANSSFEKTKAYEWLKQNAENYGFVMRYSEEKQPITGVIHESWHWRFVGINTAKKMNQLNMCLEEYLEYISKTSKH